MWEDQGAAAGERAAESVRVLLVEDDDEYAALVRRTLSRSGSFEVVREPQLGPALGRLEQQRYDAMLVDLSLPDGAASFTLGSACSVSEHVPIVFLTGCDNEDLAVAAMQSGAQEYLVKHRTEPRSLAAAIRRAIERHRRAWRRRMMESASPSAALSTRESTLWDPRMGIANELLLMDRLTRALARADRRNEPLGVLVARLNEIADLRGWLGPDLGECLLASAAHSLGRVVRHTDTLALLGRDTFAVVVEDCGSRDALELVSRLLLRALTEVRGGSDGLVVEGMTASVGAALYPADGADSETLLENAEAARALAELQGGGHACFGAQVNTGGIPWGNS